MTQNINKLLNIEVEIITLYALITDLEISNNKGSATFLAFINALKNNIEEEEKVLTTLTINELIFLRDEKKVKEVLKGKDNIDTIFERVTRRIIDIISPKILPNESEKQLSDILMSESSDIFLSYLDESIASSPNKSYLLQYKYKYICTLPKDVEKRVIERNFNTANSLYLSSLMCSQLLNIDYQSYEICKDLFSTNILESALSYLRDNFGMTTNYPEKEILFTKIRTSISLMSDRLFKEIVDTKIKGNDIIFSIVFTNTPDKSFLETIKKDRERHKVLSLIPPKQEK